MYTVEQVQRQGCGCSARGTPPTSHLATTAPYPTASSATATSSRNATRSVAGAAVQRSRVVRLFAVCVRVCVFNVDLGSQGQGQPSTGACFVCVLSLSLIMQGGELEIILNNVLHSIISYIRTLQVLYKTCAYADKSSKCENPIVFCEEPGFCATHLNLADFRRNPRLSHPPPDLPAGGTFGLPYVCSCRRGGGGCVVVPPGVVLSRGVVVVPLGVVLGRASHAHCPISLMSVGPNTTIAACCPRVTL